MNLFKSLFKSLAKPLTMLSAALLLVALATGCHGGRDPILGSGVPDLVSLAVTPATASVPITGTQQFTATATYSDGSSRNVTTVSSWISGTPGNATVGPTTGLATGLAGGTSLITATFGGMSGSATLTVNAAITVSFVVTPATASIPVSGTQQFAAIQTFSDGTTQDRTTTAVWSTNGASAANASVGAATGHAVGITVTPAGVPVVINATFGALAATPAALTVNAATPVLFMVTPATASIPVSGTQQFAAIQVFSDGTTQDRTTTSVWSTSGASAANASVGAATGHAVGITVTPAGVPVVINATFGALVATPADLTVNAATPVSFVVTPSAASIPVSGTQQFAAIQTFSDGTTQDRTTTSLWSTSGASGANASVGAATGHAVGITVTPAGVPVVINATFGALVATPAALTVNAATPVSFVVTPATASVTVSGTQQFAAIQTFSDGTTQDRTTTSVWSTGGASAADASVGSATGSALGITATPAGVPVVIHATFGVLIATPAALTVTVGAIPGPAGAVDLKSVAPFGIIAWDAMTINAGSHIYGDVALPGGVIASVVGPNTKDGGVAPNLTASAVTNSAGVTPGQINTTDNGTMTPTQLSQLYSDLNAVFLDLNTRPAPVLPLTTIASAAHVSGGTFAAATDLSGYVLSPGIYTSPATYGLSNALGPLVLDAKGNPNAIFIIRSTQVGPSGFTSTTGSVLLQGGAQAKNVYWVMDNLTIGAGTFFQGTVVAGHVITLNNFANAEGRMLAGALGVVSGAITLTGTNVITVPK